MTPLILLPFILLGIPFVPTIIEAFKRKDKGPKEIPDQTTYEEKPDLSLPRLERAREEARVKAPSNVIRITGDASIPEGTEINNDLVVQGKVKVGRKSHIYGSVKAFGSIEIGESSTVEGHVLSEGTIIIGRDCVIKGVVYSLKDIILEENAVVEAVSTEKTVKVGPNVKIARRVLSGTSIVMSPQLPLEITSLVTRPENQHAVTEKAVSRDERSIQEEELSDNELIERLIASKMRDELKRKMLVRESETLGSVQPKDILNEWEKLSSSLLKAGEIKERRESDLLKGINRKGTSTVEDEKSEGTSEK